MKKDFDFKVCFVIALIFCLGTIAACFWLGPSMSSPHIEHEFLWAKLQVLIAGLVAFVALTYLLVSKKLTTRYYWFIIPLMIYITSFFIIPIARLFPYNPGG